MATIRLPYVIWRDGRPRFQPSARERALGFHNRDLKNEDQSWFTFEQAQKFSDDIVVKIKAARASGKRVRRSPISVRTVEDLMRDYLAAFTRKVEDGVRAQSTLESYRKSEKAIRLSRAGVAEVMARTSAAAVEPPEANDFIDYLIRTRGRHMGRACRALLCASYTWARTSSAWRLTANPFGGLKFEKPEGRIVIYSDDEIRLMVEAADRIGRASIGDAILLGLFTGQRQGDRLGLEDAGKDDVARRVFRQSKTGAVVAIPETPRLAQRIADARKRAAELALKHGTRPRTIVVDETTGRAYNPHTYRHVFDDVRTAAVAASGHKALAGKRDQDLRDTAVTWLARAGCTIPEICSITGHDPKSVYTILKHYLAITPELADAAIGKLVTWMDAKGMAV